ncbi:BIR1-like protein [Mya arenaria]|uniref:BIR1-like protein n=2 Tax=Mya arenaria TaxID=6604 RepID=A0ABY7DPS5_MYAAR|nr:BIR1-like protein [Mya arenaria]
MEQLVPCCATYQNAGKRKTRRTSSKYTEFISYDKRFESFEKDWPRGLPSPKKMAKAGFFFEGIRVVKNVTFIDMVTCYQCGKTIHAWKGTDDPVEEHRRIYPTKHCVDHLS